MPSSLSLSLSATKNLPLVATAPVRACSLDILFPPTFTEPCIYRQRCNVVTLFCLGRMRFLQRQQTIFFLLLSLSLIALSLSLSLFLSRQKKATTRACNREIGNNKRGSGRVHVTLSFRYWEIQISRSIEYLSRYGVVSCVVCVACRVYRVSGSRIAFQRKFKRSRDRIDRGSETLERLFPASSAVCSARGSRRMLQARSISSSSANA